MKFLRNLKLQYKVILIAVIPVMVMCIVAMMISNTVVKNKLLDDAKQELSATAKAVLAAYDQNTGDYFVNSAGDVWKGAYNVSLSEGFIDDINKNTGVAITFFYGDRRLVTSLTDSNGKKILGSRAGEFLVKNVLEDGNEVFTNRVLVEDDFYFGYYVPVYQNNSNEIIGMIFAGMPVNQIYASLNLIIVVYSAAIFVILIMTILIGYLISRSIAIPIRDSMKTVEQLAEGNINVTIPDTSLNRKDEVGALSKSTKTLTDSLTNMIGLISTNTVSINDSSAEMKEVAMKASSAMDAINEDLQNVLSGAVEQVGSANNIRSNVKNINEHIENTLVEVDQLSSAAHQMLSAGEDVDSTLTLLNNSNKEVLEEVENIRCQTMKTNDSVENIMKAVTIISDIASQTNLLSLNASIEAARAGNAGRGFAVVADEISKLAAQSNEASEEISKIVHLLGENSSMTVTIMDAVQKAITEQTENVEQTAAIFGQVRNHISTVASGVEVIRESTTSLGAQADEIVYDIENLSNIAQSNEETVKGTIESGANVLLTVNSVTDVSAKVSTAANDMAGVVSKFKM